MKNDTSSLANPASQNDSNSKPTVTITENTIPAMPSEQECDIGASMPNIVKCIGYARPLPYPNDESGIIIDKAITLSVYATSFDSKWGCIVVPTAKVGATVPISLGSAWPTDILLAISKCDSAKYDFIVTIRCSISYGDKDKGVAQVSSAPGSIKSYYFTDIEYKKVNITPKTDASNWSRMIIDDSRHPLIWESKK